MSPHPAPNIAPNTIEPATSPADGPEALTPLPGEAGIPSVAQQAPGTFTGKRGLMFATLVLALIAASAWSFQRLASPAKKPTEATKRTTDKPAAATAEPRRLDLPPIGAAAGQPVPGNRVASTAIAPTPPEAPQGVPSLRPDPLGLHQPAAQAHAPIGMHPAAAPVVVAPEDAPIMLVSSRPQGPAPTGHPTVRPSMASPGMAPVAWVPQAAPTSGQAPANADPLTATTRNLEGYQQQLQGLLNNLTRTTALATGASAEGTPSSSSIGMPPPGGTQAMAPFGAPQGAFSALPQGTPNGMHTKAPNPSGGLFEGQLPSSNTPRVSATLVSNRSLLLPKGTAFTCALKTRVISATSGLVGCQVQRNVYSDDGRVLLIERGSHLDGEYRVANVRQGMVRIPVLWTRVRTPNGVIVDLDSPGTGALGEGGIDGHIDNRWPERIGAALLLSLIDDSVKMVISNQNNDRSGDTIVLPSTTANASRLAEKVLDSTINIPPLISQNQGGIVGIYVARDVDFSSVYELRPSAR